MSSHAQQERAPSTLTSRAVQATLHCLAGCAVGEILGMVIATALGRVVDRQQHWASSLLRQPSRSTAAPTVTAIVTAIAASPIKTNEVGELEPSAPRFRWSAPW